MGKRGTKSTLWIFGSIILLLVLFIVPPTPSQATDRYWIGDPTQSGNGDWNVDNNWNPSHVPQSGDIANIFQTDSSATALLTVTYDGTPSYAPVLLGGPGLLGQIWIVNNSGSGGPTGSGAGWIMLDQTGDMYTNKVGIGSLGVYKLDGGTLTVHSSKAGGEWTTGNLGAAGFITDMDSGQPYEGGVFYQNGSTSAVHTAALSFGWSGVRSAPGEGLYALVNGTLTVLDDTHGETIASGSPIPGNMVVGNGGNGTFFQGFGPDIPTSGAIKKDSITWNYGTGGSSVTTNNLTVGITSPPSSPTIYYGNGEYDLLSGTLTVNNNAYIGSGGKLNNDGSYSASSGDFQQGYFNPGKEDYTKGVVGDGTSQVTIKGNLYLGQGGGSGGYELYNGTLTVKGDIGIGYGGSQWSGFTQGNPYQDPISGAWKTSSTNMVSASNLYIGNGTGTGQKYWANYNLADGTLTVSGNTYVGYKGQGGFMQGVGWTDNTSIVTPGGTFQTNYLYLGGSSDNGGTTGNGNYTLANGQLTVNGDAYVGYSGQGYFSQGVAPGPNDTQTVTDGTSQVLIKGNLYLGQNQGSGYYALYNGTLTVNGDTYIGYGQSQWSGFTQGNPYQDPISGAWKTSSVDGSTNVVSASNLYIGNGTGPNNQPNYTLADGNLTVKNNTYVGYSGQGGFTQGMAWTDPKTSIPTPGGTFQTGNLYVGGSSDNGGTMGNGNYTLAKGQLTVNGDTYVGYSGQGYFSQGVAWGPNSTYTFTDGGTFQTGNLFLAYSSGSNGTYNLIYGGTANSNSPGLTVNGNAYIGYSSTGIFNQGAVYNNNQWITGDGGYVQINKNLYIGGSPDGTTGNGTYNLDYGKLVVKGDEYVGYAGQGTFKQTGGTHTVTGALITQVNPGSSGIYNMSGGKLDVKGGITNNGTFNFTGGDVITSLLQNYGLFKGGGASFTGSVINYGTVSPGSSPGTLNISGDFTQDVLGKLLIELAGYTKGSEYDFLNITGNATLGGKLHVDLLDIGLGKLFDPLVGSTFDILHADKGITGTFASRELPSLTGRLWEVDYGLYDVTLKVNAVPVPSTLLLMGTGLIGLAGMMRRKFKKN